MEIPKIINKSVLAKELGISKQLFQYNLKVGLSKELKNKIRYIISNILI